MELELDDLDKLIDDLAKDDPGLELRVGCPG